MHNHTYIYPKLLMHSLSHPLSLTSMATQAMTNGQTKKPHIILVPLMAQGHILPMINMAHILADRGGATVTLITTPANVARNKPAIDSVNVITLPFPCAAAGLPEGCESIDLVPSPALFKNFFHAMALLQHPLEQRLRDMQQKACCMIADYALPWTKGVADCLNIKRFVYHGPSCFFILCIHRINVHQPYTGLGLFDPVKLPDMPVDITVTQAQAPCWFPSPSMADVKENAIEAEVSSDGIVVNTFEEMEGDILNFYEKSIGRPVWAIGPLSMYDKDRVDHDDDGTVISWLDAMPARSVMYVNFGSVAHTKPAQLVEIGRGLEASGRPFIWVIKKSEKCSQFEESEFQSRNKERGLVITGWAPQKSILSHPSVGGFLTHCGWSSILEAVSEKVPMVTWPSFGDQILNQKLVVEVLRIGVAVGVEVPFHIAEKELVKGEDVAKAIERLMDGGEEGEGIRGRVSELGEKAKKAMEEGGSSYKNAIRLVEFIRQNSK